MKKIIIIVVIILIAGWFFLRNTEPTNSSVTELDNNENSSVVTTFNLTPSNPKAGEEVVLTISFSNQNGVPVTDFMTHHARKVHVLALAENLAHIGHVHPDDFPELQQGLEEGKHRVKFTFPGAGRYIVGVDVMNADGPLSKQALITVSGRPNLEPTTPADFSVEKCFISFPEEGGNDRFVKFLSLDDSNSECVGNAYSVSFAVDGGRVGQPTKLNFTVTKGGEPVDDLEPFLDQEMHLAIIPESLETILHRHGTVVVPEGSHVMADGTIMKNTAMEMEVAMEENMNMEADKTMSHEMNMEGHSSVVPKSFGPNLESEVLTFSNPGIYRVIGQMKHQGQILFPDFAFEIK